jgi:hypothetical protein
MSHLLQSVIMGRSNFGSTALNDDNERSLPYLMILPSQPKLSILLTLRHGVTKLKIDIFDTIICIELWMQLRQYLEVTELVAL